MITQGLSQHEINLISKVLEEHNVRYQVGTAGGEEGLKVKAGRGDASFYFIEIHDGDFESLPATAKSKLEGYGIYPEMEAPDFSDDPKEEKPAKDPEQVKKNLKKMEYIFIAVLAAMALAFVRKVMNEQ